MSRRSNNNGSPPVRHRDVLVRRVKVRNYKSIGRCDVELKPLTVLVGRNGAGKSNFLDALQFVADALQFSPQQAIKTRGGWKEVFHRGAKKSSTVVITLDLERNDTAWATYSFQIGPDPKGFATVKTESLRIRNSKHKDAASFEACDGKLVSANLPYEVPPPVSSDRLYLSLAGGLPAFRDAYVSLTGICTYNFNPSAMRANQYPGEDLRLDRDGANSPGVIGRLEKECPETLRDMITYLGVISPGITNVKRKPLGSQETLAFEQAADSGSKARPPTFHSANMSDGTLRALGALVAVAQVHLPSSVRLVGIEEPENSLHPMASGALMDALRDGAWWLQVLVTTHSADLLDQICLETEQVLAVQTTRGKSLVGPIDPASRSAIREHLYSAGELLRMNQLEVDPRMTRCRASGKPGSGIPAK